MGRKGDINKMLSTDKWLKRIRNLAGILGMILPWISVLSVAIMFKRTETPEGFWSVLSISKTYYFTPALAAILTTASIVLMTYDGYDWRDNLVTTLSGVFGIGIVLFPCDCSYATDYVGLFQVPVNISGIVHSICAIVFFLLLAFNAGFLFTLGSDDTRNKRIRKVIYRICAVGMVVSMVPMLIPVHFFAKTFIVEALALTFFGVSWLIKGNVFGILEDKD